MTRRRFIVSSLFLAISIATLSLLADDKDGFVPLFPDEGIPKGWVVRQWSDVSKPAKEGTVWKVQDGILNGSDPRGTWLVSEKLYSDFVLELDFKLGPEGNSGVGLRFPDAGDPAYDGMELQIVDPRYYGGKGEPAQLAGSIYRGIPPKKPAFKPEAWNHYQITCQGPHVKVVLNDEVIQDFNLDDQKKILHRDQPEKATAPLKDRPRKGHIGFQELSRGQGHVQIKNARIKEL
jgi:hypothetical protein